VLDKAAQYNGEFNYSPESGILRLQLKIIFIYKYGGFLTMDFL
jgi:hypothetical protein